MSVIYCWPCSPDPMGHWVFKDLEGDVRYSHTRSCVSELSMERCQIGIVYAHTHSRAPDEEIEDEWRRRREKPL